MRILKIIVDILLFLDTALLTSIDYFGSFWHEVLGISMAILIIIHLILNGKWIINVTKSLKKVNTKTKIQYFIDVLTMIIFFGAIICGIMISRDIFKLPTRSNAQIIITHLIFGRLALIIMLIHLGLHLDRIFAKVKSKKIRILIYIIYILISIILSIWSIYTLTHSFQWMMVFGM